MRKTMTKQVTRSIIKSAQMDIKDGTPVAIELDDEIVLGNYDQAKAQKYIDSKYDKATVLNVEVERLVYEMEVEEFIKYASIKE